MNSKLFFSWFLVSIALVFATFPGQLHAEDPNSILQTHEITDSDTGSTGTSAAASAATTSPTDQLLSSLDSLISHFKTLIAQLEKQLAEAESAATTSKCSGEVDVNTRLNVRVSPWGKIIGKLLNHDKVTIVAKDGDWFKIVYGDGYAYVHSNYVTTEYNDEDFTVDDDADEVASGLESVSADDDTFVPDADDEEAKQIEAAKKADSSRKSNSKKSTKSDDAAVTTRGKTRAQIVAETAIAMAKQMKKDGNWYYHDRAKRKRNKYYECSTTFAKARKGSRRTCCCHFANWAMQAAGMIEGGKVVSHTAAGKGRGMKAISHPERVKHCKFIYPNKRIKDYKSELKNGDILIHDSSICVYVVEHGRPVCYTGRDGRSMVYKNLKFKRNRVTSGYEFSRPIYVIIRPIG